MNRAGLSVTVKRTQRETCTVSKGHLWEMPVDKTKLPAWTAQLPVMGDFPGLEGSNFLPVNTFTPGPQSWVGSTQDERHSVIPTYPPVTV